MSRHFIEQCKHGTVVRQCRCPGEKRIKLLSICPPDCWVLKNPEGPRYPGPGVIVNG